MKLKNQIDVFKNIYTELATTNTKGRKPIINSYAALVKLDGAFKQID